MPLSDYNKRRKLSVDSVSGNPEISKAQPILITGGDDSTTGNGDIVIDFSNVNSPGDIAVFDENGNLLDYEIQKLDIANETGILWAYNDWVRDGTTQAQLAYGNNSANTDRQNVTGTWSNTEQNAEAIYHLEDTSDSAGNTSNLSVNGAAPASGSLGGGFDFDGSNDTLENPNTTAQAWSTDISDMPTQRYGLTSSVTPDGEIYAIGGLNNDGNNLSDVEKYNPDTDSWSIKTSMPDGTGEPASAVGPNGDIYVLGGFTASGNNDKVQKYDVSSDSWSTVASMPTARNTLTASAGPNGNIYAIGGSAGNDNALTTVEKYDPDTDSWSTLSSMPTARQGLASSVVDGEIYAIGGKASGSALTTVEKYDISSDSWSTLANMDTARNLLTSSVGPNANIYAIGGTTTDFTVRNSVEKYDILNDSWTTVNSLPVSRFGPASSVVNGIIYVIGGRGDPRFSILNDVSAGDFPATKPPVDPGAPMTVVAVVNNDVTPDDDPEDQGNMGLVGTQTSFFDNENGYDLSQFSGDDQFGFAVEHTGNRTGTRATLVDSEWVGKDVQFAGTVTSDRVRVFKDGSLASEKSGSIGDFTGTDNFRIGALDQGGNGNFYDGQIFDVRIFSEEKREAWMEADYDAIPEAGQVFFSQQAENPPGVENFNKVKSLNVDSVSGSPTVEKAQPIVVSGGDDSTTGNGDIVIDFTSVSGPEDIAVFDQNGELLDYHIEELDTVNNEATIWIYNTWSRDGTVQAQLAFGNNITGKNRENIDGAWKDAKHAWLLSDNGSGGIDATDVAGTKDGSVSGAQLIDGQFGSAAKFGGNDFITTSNNNVPKKMTVALFFSTNDVNNKGRVVTQEPTGASGDWFIRGFSSYIFKTEPGGGGGATSGTALSEGQVTNYVVTSDSGSGAMRLFQDGQLEGSDNGFFSFDNSFNFTIGQASNTNANQPLKGTVDAVRKYSSLKDESWAKADFDASPLGGQVFFSQQAAATTEKAKLNGQVTLAGSPVQGAVVYAFDNTEKEFVGFTTTDSNGDYSITPSKRLSGNEVLIGVDHDTGSQRFGEEKSTVV